MNLDTYEKLKLNHLNTSFVPTLKGATGHDMLTKGITFDLTKKLCTDDKLVLETEDNFEGKTLALSRSICIPPRCTAVAEVTCLTNMDGKFQVQLSPVFPRDNPNVYCKPIIYDMSLDMEQI